MPHFVSTPNPWKQSHLTWYFPLFLPLLTTGHDITTECSFETVTLLRFVPRESGHVDVNEVGDNDDDEVAATVSLSFSPTSTTWMVKDLKGRCSNCFLFCADILGSADSASCVNGRWWRYGSRICRATRLNQILLDPVSFSHGTKLCTKHSRNQLFILCIFLNIFIYSFN